MKEFFERKENNNKKKRNMYLHTCNIDDVQSRTTGIFFVFILFSIFFYWSTSSHSRQKNFNARYYSICVCKKKFRERSNTKNVFPIKFLIFVIKMLILLYKWSFMILHECFFGCHYQLTLYVNLYFFFIVFFFNFHFFFSQSTSSLSLFRFH